MIDTNTHIGMIGVGLMGHGIASNIVKHGYALGVLDHPGNQPTDDLLEAGAVSFASIAELVAHSDVLILCVTGTPQVEDVLYQTDGVLQHLRKDMIVIDCSTAIPSSTEKIAKDVHAAGGRFLDAPMTRTPKEAAQGRLNLLVGGASELFAECQPLLASYAENIVHVGPVGAGHRMKLLHNFVSLGFSTVLAEAAACSNRAGIDPKTLVKVLDAGGGQGVVLERLRPYMESGDISGFRFSISNAHKDLGYYTTMAGETGSFNATAQAILNTLATGLEQKPKAIVPELITILEHFV